MKIEIPVNIGDKAYIVKMDAIEGEIVEEVTIVQLRLYVYSEENVKINYVYKCTTGIRESSELYFSQQEAEQALAKMIEDRINSCKSSIAAHERGVERNKKMILDQTAKLQSLKKGQ